VALPVQNRPYSTTHDTAATTAAVASRRHRAHYRNTWRHSQKRKYITYIPCIQRRERRRSRGHRQCAHGKFGEVRARGSLYMHADGQTDRRTCLSQCFTAGRDVVVVDLRVKTIMLAILQVMNETQRHERYLCNSWVMASQPSQCFLLGLVTWLTRIMNGQQSFLYCTVTAAVYSSFARYWNLIQMWWVGYHFIKETNIVYKVNNKPAWKSRCGTASSACTVARVTC